MIIYNVTIKIDPVIEQEWVAWMKQEHIPDVMATGMFRESRLARLLDVDESDGITFSAQYTAETREKYEQYIQQHAAGLRKKGTDRWGDRFIAFRTLMEVVR